MAYKIETTSYGVYIRTPDGNAVRTTAGEVFETTSRSRAEEVVAYLSQEVVGNAKKVGPHWLKSTFGVF